MAGFRVGLGPNSLTGTRGSWLAWALIHAITCRRQGKTSRYFDLADEKKTTSAFVEMLLAIPAESSAGYIPRQLGGNHVGSLQATRSDLNSK